MKIKQIFLCVPAALLLFCGSVEAGPALPAIPAGTDLHYADGSSVRDLDSEISAEPAKPVKAQAQPESSPSASQNGSASAADPGTVTDTVVSVKSENVSAAADSVPNIVTPALKGSLPPVPLTPEAQETMRRQEETEKHAQQAFGDQAVAPDPAAPVFGTSQSTAVKSDAFGLIKEKKDPDGINIPETNPVQPDDGIDGEDAAQMLSTAGAWVQGFYEADDKEEWLLSQANGYVSGVIDSEFNEALEQFSGVHAELSLGLHELTRLEPSGKILVPLYNTPVNFVYLQGGLTHAPNDRNILHLGGGYRLFPEAVSKTEVGSYMLGINSIYDLDLNRGHERFSLGLEAATEYFFISANMYRRTTGWKASRDFDSVFVQERPANGFDIRTKWFLPANFTRGLGAAAITADIAHWEGKKVSPFGNSGYDALEDSPWIYSAGLEWQIVPAIALAAKHEVTDNGHHNSLLEVKFNIPLDDYGFRHAFDPHASSLSSGFSLKTMRYAFVNRDYSMPLQYRSKPGKFHVRYLGQYGDRGHIFQVLDGFGKPAPGVPVNVTPEDSCIKLTDDGHYVTGADGKFVMGIKESCTNKTKVTIRVGDETIVIPIDIRVIDLTITANPAEIERVDTSTVLLKGTPNSAGRAVKWSLKGPGKISDLIEIMSDKGEATALYTPDKTLTTEQEAYVTALYEKNSFTAKIRVRIFGNAPGSFNGGKATGNVVEGTSVTEITYKDLKPGSDTFWQIDGDAKISPNADGSDVTNQLTVKADENGVAHVYIVADDADTGKATVQSATRDTLAPTQKAEFDIKSYVASYETPAFVAPGDDFTVKLTGLKPGTEVLWSDADYADLQGDVKTTVAEDGSTSALYAVKHDHWSGTIDQIQADYYRNVTKRTQLPIPAIPVHEHILSLSEFPANFSGDDSFVITLSGGKPGYEVAWSCENVGMADQQETFDASGNATAKISGIAPFTGVASVTAVSMGKTLTQSGNGGAGYRIWAPKMEVPAVTPFLQDTEIKFTDLQPNSKITLSVTSDTGSVKLRETELTATPDSTGANGTATAIIESIGDFTTTKYSVTAVAHTNSAETVTLTGASDMKPWALSLDASASAAGRPAGTLDAYNGSLSELDHATVTISGGIAGQRVSWSVSGDGTMTSQQESFDADGNATAVIWSKPSFQTAPTVTVETLNQTLTLEFKYDVSDYTPTAAKPAFVSALYGNSADTVDYDEESTITYTGLLPNSPVVMSGPLNMRKLANSDGTATFTLPAVKDQAQTTVTPTIRYVTSGSKFATRSDTLKVHQYTLTMTQSKTSLDAYNGNYQTPDTATVTLSGGKPGAPVDWQASTAATLENAQATFGADGKATAVLKAKTPFNGTPSVSATALNRTNSANLPYALTTYNASVNLPTYSSTVYGNVANQIDVDTGYTVTVSGLLPGSTVTMNAPVAGRTATVAANGVATFDNLPAVGAADNYQTKSLTPTFTYIQKGAATAQVAKALSVHQYSLNMTTDKTEIYGDETFTATVTGGKPGAAVDWSLTGSGKYTAKAATFDENGKAVATVQGIDPFTQNITAIISFANKSVSKNMPFFTLKIADGGICYGMGYFPHTRTGVLTGFNENPSHDAPNIMLAGFPSWVTNVTVSFSPAYCGVTSVSKPLFTSPSDFRTLSGENYAGRRGFWLNDSKNEPDMLKGHCMNRANNGTYQILIRTEGRTWLYMYVQSLSEDFRAIK